MFWTKWLTVFNVREINAHCRTTWPTKLVSPYLHCSISSPASQKLALFPLCFLKQDTFTLRCTLDSYIPRLAHIHILPQSQQRRQVMTIKSQQESSPPCDPRVHKHPSLQVTMCLWMQVVSTVKLQSDITRMQLVFKKSVLGVALLNLGLWLKGQILKAHPIILPHQQNLFNKGGYPWGTHIPILSID